MDPDIDQEQDEQHRDQPDLDRGQIEYSAERQKDPADRRRRGEPDKRAAQLPVAGAALRGEEFEIRPARPQELNGAKPGADEHQELERPDQEREVGLQPGIGAAPQCLFEQRQYVIEDCGHQHRAAEMIDRLQRAPQHRPGGEQTCDQHVRTRHPAAPQSGCELDEHDRDDRQLDDQRHAAHRRVEQVAAEYVGVDRHHDREDPCGADRVQAGDRRVDDPGEAPAARRPRRLRRRPIGGRRVRHARLSSLRDALSVSVGLAAGPEPPPSSVTDKAAAAVGRYSLSQSRTISALAARNPSI